MQTRNRQMWIALAGLMGAFTVLSVLVHARLLVNFDTQVASWLYRHGAVPMDWVMNVLTFTGNPELNGLMVGAMALAFWRHSDWRPAGWTLGIFVAMTLLELVLKFCIDQPGPGKFNRHVIRLEGFIELSLPYAFPSGHTLRIVYLCGLMAQWFNPRGAIGWWILAGIVAFSRIYLGAHWTTDVIGGVFLGIAGVLLLGNRLEALRKADQQPRVQISSLSAS